MKKRSPYFFAGLLILIGAVLFLIGYLTSTANQPNPEALQEKDIVEFLIDDDMRLGNEKAEIVIVEFSDFQCPFCRAFWLKTLPQLKQDIEEGEVLFVYRDLPLPFHPAAYTAAEAVECADDKGLGWALHDKIFEEQAKRGEGTIMIKDEEIMQWVKELCAEEKIEMQVCADIEECVRSRKYKEEVKKDMDAAMLMGAQGTPTFIIINRKTKEYEVINGAQPYIVFKQKIRILKGER